MYVGAVEKIRVGIQNNVSATKDYIELMGFAECVISLLNIMVLIVNAILVIMGIEIVVINVMLVVVNVMDLKQINV